MQSLTFLVPYNSYNGMKNRENSGTYIAPDDVVGVIHYIPGKAEVTYFHHFSMGH